MTFNFRPALRENVPLLIGLAGGTGSGKTLSGMMLAKGMAGGKPFAVIDTEAGRAKHYADQFKFDHGDLKPPFRPKAYLEAIIAADKANYPVVMVDSTSHEWAGDGGILDWQEEEFAAKNYAEAYRMSSWIKPKMAHKEMVTNLLQVRAHVILCFRAEEKIDMVKDPQTGKFIIVPKATRTGLDGWVPICEKTLPFELTASFLLTADAPGFPKPIKLEQQMRGFFPLDQPITSKAGEQLAAWALGGKATESAPEAQDPPMGVWAAFWAKCSELGWNEAEVKALADMPPDIFSTQTREELQALLRRIKAAPQPAEQPALV